MTRSLGSELPSGVVIRLSQADLTRYRERVLPLVTVDAGGFPHPMLLSSVEVRAIDPKTIRIVIGARSRSARNLLEREVATLLIVEPERTVYVKVRVIGEPQQVSGIPEAGLFHLTVEDVLEDMPAEWEGGMKMVGGMTYAPVPSLDDPRVKATVNALARSMNT
jgi:hypothetical protein